MSDHGEYVAKYEVEGNLVNYSLGTIAKRETVDWKNARFDVNAYYISNAEGQDYDSPEPCARNADDH